MTTATAHFEPKPAPRRPVSQRSPAAVACDFIHELDGNDCDNFIDVPGAMTAEEFRVKVRAWAEAIVEDLDPWSWGDALTKPERSRLTAALVHVGELALAGHVGDARAEWERAWEVRPSA